MSDLEGQTRETAELIISLIKAINQPLRLLNSYVTPEKIAEMRAAGVPEALLEFLEGPGLEQYRRQAVQMREKGLAALNTVTPEEVTLGDLYLQ